jgi:Acyl-CoA dehydrogenase, N-terminal domain
VSDLATLSDAERALLSEWAGPSRRLLTIQLQGTSSAVAGAGHFIVADTTRPHERWEPPCSKRRSRRDSSGLIPAPFGGVAAGGVEACILIEEWACHSPDFVISLAGPLIAFAPVYEAGTPEQIQRFVVLVVTGSHLLSPADPAYQRSCSRIGPSWMSRPCRPAAPRSAGGPG